MRSLFYTRGLTVVEIVIAAAIIISVVIGASAAWQTYIRLASTGTNTTQAVLMATEAAEALQSMRDTSWTTNIAPVVVGTTYYLSWTGSQYQLTTTPISIQNLTRTIVFSNVVRNAATHVISTSGTIDAGSLYALITVSPTGSASTTLAQTQTIIYNTYAN